MESTTDYTLNSIQEEQNGKKMNPSALRKYTLDEAIQLTGHGRFNILVVFLSGVAMMGATIENLSLAFVLPYANCDSDLNMTTTELGLASSIPFFGIVISSHGWGILADTWGRKKVMRLSATCALICSFLSAFSPNAPILILLRCFVGIFISGLQASVYSYVSEFHTKDTAPRATAFTSIFMQVNLIYASTFAIPLMPMSWSVDIWFIKFVPWRLFILVVALINFVNAVAFSLLPESPKFLLVMNKSEEALDVLKQMYKTNTGNPKELYPVRHLIHEASGSNLMTTKGFLNILKLVWNQTKTIFIPLYLDSTIKLCFMMFVLYSIGQGIMLWLPNFLIQLRNSSMDKTVCAVVGHEKINSKSNGECGFDKSDTTTYQIMLCIGCLYTVMSGLISFYLKKIAPRYVVPIWIVAAAACSISLNFITQFYAIVVAFVTFQSCFMCAGIVSALSIGLYPTNVRAMATCFILMFGRIGSLAGTNLVGSMLTINCDLIFNVFGGFAFACALVFLLLKTEPPTSVKSDQRNEFSA